MILVYSIRSANLKGPHCHARENVWAPTSKFTRLCTKHIHNKSLISVFSCHVALILFSWSRVQRWVTLMEDSYVLPLVQTAVDLERQKTQWRTLRWPIQIPTPAGSWVTTPAKTATALKVPEDKGKWHKRWFCFKTLEKWLVFILIHWKYHSLWTHAWTDTFLLLIILYHWLYLDCCLPGSKTEHGNKLVCTENKKKKSLLKLLFFSDVRRHQVCACHSSALQKNTDAECMHTEWRQTMRTSGDY